MPRSGTTWLSQIFEAHPRFITRLSPNYSYVLKNRLTPDSTEAEWRSVLGEAAATSDPFMTQNWQRDAGNLPWFEPSDEAQRLAVKDTRFHETYLAGMGRLPDAFCIYLVRNPCATLDSWRRSPEFPANAGLDAEWRSGACRKGDGPGEYWGFADWVTLTRRYRQLAREEPSRYRVVRYEELVRHPNRGAEDLFRFVGEALDPQVVDFIAASQATHTAGPYSVFKDPVTVLTRWKESFPATIAAEIQAALAGTELEEYLE